MLSGLVPATLALALIAGVLLDLMLGEARRWHPLVGFGRLASALERWLNKGASRIARGLLAWMLAVLPLSLLAWLVCAYAGAAAHALLLYLGIGLRSLRDHTLPIHAALVRGDLDAWMGNV